MLNISFDLDSTLIPNGNEFETEKQSFLIKLFRVEKIRKGTCELFDYLQKQGHTINIYTTSYRSKTKIRFMFLLYGLRVTKIINQTENINTLKSLKIKHQITNALCFGFQDPNSLYRPYGLSAKFLSISK